MADVPPLVTCHCQREARRVFAPPAAIHFRCGGFYQTDVREKIHRKRRANPGDDLPVEFDGPAARIADAV
jgi:predicted nucleic acid-binding Zn ribbon protein